MRAGEFAAPEVAMPSSETRASFDKLGSALLVMCFIKIEGEVHCVGAGLVPARAAAGCGPPGGHKGRPYESQRLADPSI